MAIEDEKHFAMECVSLSTCRKPFFDALEQIIPSFASKTVDEKKIIAEPKYKYGQQEQVTVRNHNRSTALERSV